MEEIKQDIKNKEDIILMVNSFYEKVNNDTILSYVFNDFAKVDWDEHLPKLHNFWNSLIFTEPDYRGNPFAAHINLPIQKEHFEKWLELFDINMDELFAGEIAEATKSRAKSIAQIFQSKLQIFK